MTFKFVAKNLQTGKTGAVTVKAEREAAARQRLALSGYEVICLMRVSNEKVTSVGCITLPRLQSSRRPTLSRKAILKVRVSAFLHDLFAPFALFA